jgi:signal transduction histidine kinase
MTPAQAAGLPSITGRVSRALLLWAVLWGAALALAVWLAVQHEVDELLDDTLQAAAEEMFVPLLHSGPQALPAAVADKAAADGAVAAAAAAPRQQASGRFVWQWVMHASDGAASARVLRASSAAPTEPLRATATAGFSDVPGWRVYGVPLGPPGQWLYAAQTRVERRETRVEVALAVTLATLPMAALALVWLRARVRHELRPLLALSERLAGHDPLAPGASLGPAQRQELQPVHDAVDTLGQRLARRMAQERAFAAHAAHALRTPLAGIDAQLAVALREAPAELQPRLKRVRAAAGRLQRVVAALLTLFRSGVELQRVRLPLAELLSRMPVEGLTVQVQATHEVRADCDLITAALLNLLDNAVRHGAHHVVVSTPGPNRLRMDDDGPGASAERRQALQHELDRQEPEGSVGLGLVLADLVARAHGGGLRLPDTEPGFAVELTLAPA